MIMDNKKARTIYPVIDLLRDRWSPRSFSPAAVSETDMHTLLEAASWSFSSGNLQPWYYIYAHRGTEGFNRILGCLSESNQSWAKSAAVLMVGLARLERDPGKPNQKARHDLGAANMSLILQARSMNIFGHPMGGYEASLVYQTLDVDPSVYEPVACIALGYLGNPDQLEGSQREKELAVRTRKGIGEISRKI
jgi:nitroreductase